MRNCVEFVRSTRLVRLRRLATVPQNVTRTRSSGHDFGHEAEPLHLTEGVTATDPDAGASALDVAAFGLYCGE